MKPASKAVQPPAPKGVQLPASATNNWIVAASFLTYAGCLVAMRVAGVTDIVTVGLLSLFATAAVNFTLDSWILKVHLRASTGLDWTQNKPSWARAWTKFAGLLGSFGFVAALYWLFPEYHGTFYDRFYAALKLILPWWILLALPYFYLVDSKQKEPRDGYYTMGLVVLGQWSQVDRKLLGQHLLGWMVKGYFLPLMLTYFFNDLTRFLAFNYSNVKDFRTFFDATYDLTFLLDVGLSSMGYLMAVRVFDSHLRWAEPTMRGWVVALLCYQPFWSMVSQNYIDYTRNFAWGAWLWDRPQLYMAWGSCILILYGIYVWATIMFGCRFSNLTHRGILTNGPFRWTKHPAYISKNLAWWLTAVPFIVTDTGVLDSVRRCTLLLFLNAVYYLRAKTEEAHLSQDPTYVEYAKWIDQHGIFSFLKRRR